MTTLKAREQGTEKALGLTVKGNGDRSQDLEVAEQVYCAQHGLVKIPEWVGVEVDGRQIIVTEVKDAISAIEVINRYQHNGDVIVLIKWDSLITLLDKGRIGPSWTLNGAAADEADEIECSRCCQPFVPVWGDERVCDECWLAENGPRW